MKNILQIILPLVIVLGNCTISHNAELNNVSLSSVLSKIHINDSSVNNINNQSENNSIHSLHSILNNGQLEIQLESSINNNNSQSYYQTSNNITSIHFITSEQKIDVPNNSINSIVNAMHESNNEGESIYSIFDTEQKNDNNNSVKTNNNIIRIPLDDEDYQNFADDEMEKDKVIDENNKK